MALGLALSAGCEEPRHVAGEKRAPAPPPAPKEEDTFIVGKRTTDVRNAAPELEKGAQEGSTKIVAKDPITLAGNAYVTMIGRTSILEIEHAMNLYKATNDRYPKDFAEFKTDILQANNIALPQLPYYQKYGYDEKEHKLIILEYPDLKNQVPR
jgi:hypothetical protein